LLFLDQRLEIECFSLPPMQQIQRSEALKRPWALAELLVLGRVDSVALKLLEADELRSRMMSNKSGKAHPSLFAKSDGTIRTIPNPRDGPIAIRKHESQTLPPLAGQAQPIHVRRRSFAPNDVGGFDLD
jgi:hypothetical protein